MSGGSSFLADLGCPPALAGPSHSEARRGTGAAGVGVRPTIGAGRRSGWQATEAAPTRRLAAVAKSIGYRAVMAQTIYATRLPRWLDSRRTAHNRHLFVAALMMGEPRVLGFARERLGRKPRNRRWLRLRAA